MKIAVLITSFALLLTNNAPANAIYNVAPKVGQCFMHSNGDVSADYPLKNPISCGLRHNAEIYYLAKWPFSTKPSQMVYEDAWKIADALCNSKALAAKLAKNNFNYWAWYTPSDQAWNAGQRWVRCDAMYISKNAETDDLSQFVFATWSGKKFK